MNLTGVKLCLPVHFKESVLLYAITGSKLAFKMFGCGGAHASYDAVKSWLASLGSKPIEAPEGDLIIAFDNNQVIQRRWKVKLKNEVACNVVTVVACFQLNNDGALQRNVQFHPSSWCSRILDEDEQKSVSFIDKTDEVRNAHHLHLHAFLDKQIAIVAAEQNTEDNVSHDKIDTNVEVQRKAAIYKTCYNCGHSEIPKSKHKCPTCGTSLTKAAINAHRMDQANVDGTSAESSKPREYRVTLQKASSGYSVIYDTLTEESHEYQDYANEQGQSDIKSKIHVLEPVYLNPCGYAAVAEVLREIGQRAKVTVYGGPRKWVVVVCDGIAYTLATRLIKSTWICLTCKESIYGRDASAQHVNDVHPNQDAEVLQEFT